MTTPRLTKEYLATKEIPQLFECLMTGLMYHRPVDHISYLQECLQNIKHQGITGVRWDLLLEAKRAQTPLPPITPTNGLPKDMVDLDKSIPKKSPLPNIGRDQLVLKCAPGAEFIFAFTAPGTNLRNICEEITSQLPGFIFLSVGVILKQMLKSYAGSKDDAYEEAGEKMARGELVDDNITLAAMVSAINKHPNAKGFVIHGFPKTKEQVHLFEETLANIRYSFIVDYYENQVMGDLSKEYFNSPEKNDRALQKRVQIYKDRTLPACKHLDDADKLFLAEGEKCRSEIINLTVAALQEELKKAPKSQGGLVIKSAQESPSLVPRYNIEVKDIGRKMDVTQLPIILLYGGPGCGKSEVANHLQQKYPGLRHVNTATYADEDYPVTEEWNMDVYDLKRILNKTAEDPGATGIILEGYPKDEAQLNEFNFEIGGPDLVILLDTFEPWMKTRLTERGVEMDIIEQRIDYYAKYSLGVIRYYDDGDRLTVLFAERNIQEIIDTISPRVEMVLQISSPNGTMAPIPELKNAKVIFVLGGPGSGKGTQCDKIVQKYGFTHLSSGDLLRAEVESGSEKGKQLKATMEKGELVSLDEVLNLLKNAMKQKASSSKGFLIDGYPRELDQGKRFENEIVECQCVIMFDLSEEVMKQRLLKRGETSGRADDNEDTIIKRFKTFKDFTVPVVKYYEDKKKLHKLDASGTVDDIFSQVVQIIDKL